VPEIPNIPEIGVGSVYIPPVPVWQSLPLQSLPSAPPITSGLGFPIIQMPGCVKTRKIQPGNNDAYDNDPKGNYVLCDGTAPYYEPLNFTPGTLIYGTAKPPAIEPKNEAKNEAKPADSKNQPASPPLPSVSAGPTDMPILTKDLPCPPPDAIPIGAKNKSQTAIIVAYNTINGDCVPETETLPVINIIDNYLPGAPVVITTATITSVATTVAIFVKPLGDFALRAVKPIVKKTIKKIKEKLTRKKIIESVFQRQVSQRRLRK
tara:strand:+ start:17573 stop:18361 length:789 start_codon:yes stop_codon:yes gene_type:complete